MGGNRWLVLVGAAVLVLVPVTGGSAAKSVSYQVGATLTTLEEVPKATKPSLAFGTFGGVIRDGKFRGVLVYSAAGGITKGKATAAHIHHARRGKAGPVVRTLCSGNCRLGGKELQFAVSGQLLAWMRAGETYVNVHTAANPAGEIRGQIKVGKPLG